jgi:hypothetical protein
VGRLAHPFRHYPALLIRNYSIKRIVVKGGKRASIIDMASSKVTPTQETETGGTLDDLEIADEKHERSRSDLEMNIGENDTIIVAPSPMDGVRRDFVLGRTNLSFGSFLDLCLQ